MSKPVCPRCLNISRGIAAGDPEHPHPGPFTRELCSACEAQTGLTADDKTEISQAFSAGNYAAAYETEDLDEALEAFNAESDDDSDTLIRYNRPDHERFAFIVGFFASCELHEISDREAYDEAYWSTAGRACVEAGYIDSRDEDYAAEAEAC